ncbi:MAG: hypothetical protein LAT66_03985 [Alkalimonas sp.]|nr:hypothetical protein [Alkalimonas sp.]
MRAAAPTSMQPQPIVDFQFAQYCADCAHTEVFMNQNNDKNNAGKSAQPNQTTNNPKGDNKGQKGQSSTLPAGEPKQPKQDPQKASKN